MKLFPIVILCIALSAACGSTTQHQQPLPEQQQASTNQGAPSGPASTDEYWAKDNFDLQRAGDLLERAESPEEFEWFINGQGDVNNLDLNGDGNVDYISVREFDDRDDNTRGLSLFTQFGPGLVQEVATALFFRDAPTYPGSRMMLTGNDQIFGDNSFYEANALDRSLALVSNLFGRNEPYRSPYYFGNYPSGYNAFPVVETPLFATRMTELYPKPMFAYTAAPTFLNKVKIKSPNNGLHLGQIRARLVKPTKEQAEFYNNNPSKRYFAKYTSDKPGRPDPPRSDRGDERGNPSKDDRGAERGNPGKPDRTDVKVSKPDNPGKGQGGKPDKGDGGQGKGGGKKP